MAVTIRDISIKCGVSPATVSKALNDYNEIKEETRTRIKKAAKEMGYRPNLLARALKTNRTHTIGILFEDAHNKGLTNLHFDQILEGFKSEVEHFGFDVTFISHRIGDTDMTYMDHCRYRNVDGICIASANFYSEEILEVVNSGFAVVTLDHIFQNVPCVLSDNINDIQKLVRYIHAQGHRDIGYIYGILPSAVTESRLTGFHRAVRDLQMNVRPEHLIQSSYHHPPSGEAAMRQLLSQKHLPSCVLLPDDYTAQGCILAIREAGLRIPEDISIAGYDGTPVIQMMSPHITTICQDTSRLGRECARRLVDRIENPTTAGAETITVPGTLLQGETIQRIVDKA